MKLIITAITAILLFSTTVWAGPFLVCDTQEGVTEYKLIWDDGEIEYSDALITIVEEKSYGAANHDMTTVKDGQSSGELFAGKPWILDGVDQNTLEWSDPSPFVLARPSKPLSPTNIGLSE